MSKNRAVKITSQTPAQAAAHIAEALTGKRLYTVTLSIAPGGPHHYMKAYTAKDDQIIDLTWWICCLLQVPAHDRDGRWQIKRTGGNIKHSQHLLDSVLEALERHGHTNVTPWQAEDLA